VSEALLTVLKWCLLALLYLFFLRVLQATWSFSGSSAGAVASGSSGTSRRPRRTVDRPNKPVFRSLRVLEPPELLGRSFEIKGEATIGRAAGCEITLDDTFISQMHARLSLGESGVVLEDLGSTNGTYLNRQKVTSASVVQPGDRIQVGGTILELQ
jgi:hypothetical protein